MPGIAHHRLRNRPGSVISHISHALSATFSLFPPCAFVKWKAVRASRKAVPPRIEQEDVFRRREVEADAARFEADEEELAVGIGLEAFDLFLTVARLAVEIFVSDAGAIEPRADDGEEAGELREDERFLAFFDHLFEMKVGGNRQ